MQKNCDRCHADGVPIGMKNLIADIFFWQCTKCENRWHHWPTGTWEYEKADPFVQRGRERA